YQGSALPLSHVGSRLRIPHLQVSEPCSGTPSSPLAKATLDTQWDPPPEPSSAVHRGEGAESSRFCGSRKPP
ncbi:MAG: hypothetical protein OXG81_13555, partial [Acidobacteria bacterium]|nr:hypothetical protein [Acidobacteriota bacterium]